MAKIGLTGCDLGLSYFLSRQIGTSAASELHFTGRFLKADRAYQLGYLSEVCEDINDMNNKCTQLLDEMLNLTQFSLEMTKDGLNQAIDM